LASNENQAGKGEIALRVELNLTDDTPTYYINYAEVSRSAVEIGIGFALLPTKLNSARLAEAQVDGRLIHPPLFHVVMLPDTARGLISALQQQLDEFDRAKKRSE
jgi:hypothetical protein